MYRQIFIAASLSFFCCATSVHAIEAEKVSVAFKQADEFTDFRSANGGRNEGRNALMAELERFMRQRGRLWLPETHRLNITFTDIDLAGRIVPLPLRATVGASTIGGFGSTPYQRVVEPAWPPRLQFEYQITDQEGRIVDQGQADIKERSFFNLSSRTSNVRQGALSYEKALLDIWMRDLYGEDRDKE